MPTQTSTGKRERAPHLGPERRRPQVLDAARSLAVREGLGAVTIGALAAELGVTRAVVYACFGDRVELLGALLDREQELLVADLMGALYSTGSTAPPEEAFVGGCTALLEAVERRPDTWRLVLEGEPDPALSARMREARAVVRDKATAWIEPAIARWWRVADLDRKLPVLIELFMASCESAIRSLLDPTNDWGPDDLGAFIGSAVHRAFAGA